MHRTATVVLFALPLLLLPVPLAAQQLELLLEIGQGSDPEALLAAPSSFLVSGGEVFVTDGDLRRIQVYSAQDGTWLRSIGRPGEGPGEFDRPMGTHLGPDGRLVVFDFFNHRISWFDPSGRFLNSEPTQRKYLTTVPIPLGTGEYLLTQSGGMRIFSWERDGEPVQKGLLRIVGPDWETTRWIGTWTRDPDHTIASMKNSAAVARHPDGRIAAAFEHRNAIHIYAETDGSLLHIITRELPFRVAGPAVEQAPRSGGGGGASAGLVQTSGDVVSVAAAFDGPGRLWVLTRILPDEEAEPRLEEGITEGIHRLEVYGPSGALLTTLPFQEGADAISFGPEGDLWVLDSEVSAVIRRYRVIWP